MGIIRRIEAEEKLNTLVMPLIKMFSSFHKILPHYRPWLGKRIKVITSHIVCNLRWSVDKFCGFVVRQVSLTTVRVQGPHVQQLQQ